VNRSGTVYIEIWRNLNGTWQQLGPSKAVTGNATSGTLQFVVLGGNLSVTFTDLSANVTLLSEFDLTITGVGQVGIRSWGSGAVLDNYSAASP
jgi:hypothetical protein